jgi:asparaginyl-tRNA synthetase
MKKSRIYDLCAAPEKFIGQEVLIQGWLKSLRKSKAFSFMVLNDGSYQKDFQIVADEKLAGYEEFVKSNIGTSMSICGTVVKSQGQNQAIELQASSVEIVGTVAEDYPLQKKGTSLEFLREVAHLRPRTNTFGAVFRVRHALSMATHKFFDEKGLFYLHTPIITGLDCEGAGEMFRVTTLDLMNIPKNDKGQVDFSKDYFAKETSLCVSGQLEGEAFACGMGGIYTFGPTFRSENSNTSRHLAEFWMIEPELAFAGLDDVAELAAEYIQYMIKYAMEKCPLELEFFNQMYDKNLLVRLNEVMNTPFKKITYTEAIEILKNTKEKFDFIPDWGMDMQTEHERYLCEKHFNGPVIVTDYPKDIKAFYMKLNPDGKTVRAMDVLVPGVGELIGGSQREEDHDKLIARMEEMQMDVAAYKWFLDLRRFGTVPHAGFGLGFERAVMYITGMSNIRDVIPFARTPKNAEF